MLRDDPDCKPLRLIAAAKLAGIKPDVMRRYLDRVEVRSLLRAERRTFREAICAGNEGALKRVRDQAGNGMAVVASVRALEQLDSPQAAVNVNIEIKAGYVIDLREPPAVDSSGGLPPA